MEEKLILHKPIHQPRNNDVILQLTDIQLHRNRDETKNPAKRVERAVETNKKGRIYSSLPDPSGPMHIQTPFFNADDPELQKLVKKYNQQGKRVFIAYPKKGLPIKLGKDAQEFVNSKKGKRIIRQLNKDKDK